MGTRVGRRRGLRTGYTTGACAAAAAKAAAIVLLRQQLVTRVEITLPGGRRAGFAVSECTFDESQASCSVIKDAGDDPDITDGAEIRATVRRRDAPGIAVHAGKGVGVVTKAGLEVAVGMPAINPVPGQMILQSVREVIGDGAGLAVTISVPQGEALAKRTLNSRLGILGGISILGTTGIVIPYSMSAYTACVSQAMGIAVASGCAEVVLTTGRRSEKFAMREMGLPEECFIQAGDFIGYSLRECARKGVPRATVWGMIGKMSKLAAGHLYTNVSDSTVDIGLLVRLAAESGLPGPVVQALAGAVTANHLRRMLPPEHAGDFCSRVCRLAAAKCRAHVDGQVEVRCIVTDPEGTVLGRGNAPE